MACISLKLIESFEYTHQDTIIHSLDPRTKIMYSLTVLILALLTTNLIPLFLLFIIQIPLVYFARIGNKWKQTIQGLTLLVVLIILLNSFLIPPQVNPHPTSSGIAVTFRIFASFTAFNLLFQTIDPDDLAQALQKMGAPYSFAWTFSTAYRFVPILAAEANTIREAQLSRGLQLDKGNFISRFRKTLPLIIPLFASTLRRAQELAEAMEARAWDPHLERTYFYEVSMRRVDLIITGLCFLTLIFAILFNGFIPLTPPYWWNWNIPPQFELRSILQSLIEFIR